MYGWEGFPLHKATYRWGSWRLKSSLSSALQAACPEVGICSALVMSFLICTEVLYVLSVVPRRTPKHVYKPLCFPAQMTWR